jgi:hypothetical protein
MYWDVIEVKPEPDYWLFVRFEDGLRGRLQLRREDLTGALAPLLDVQFFERAFIDCGAVAWPGEIDLAPDAMYVQVASQRRESKQEVGKVTGTATFRSQLPRFYELKELLTDPSHPDAYFRNFEDCLLDEPCFQTVALWEKKLQGLDPVAWESLKSKASPYLKRKDAKGRNFQQLFDVLGEASAYNYLRESHGCSRVCFIPESDDRTPDLEGVRDCVRVLCEVKTINISEDEIRARRGPPTVRKVENRLDNGFLRKLDSDVTNAKSQLRTYDPDSDAQHLVYINICFDDWLGLYKEDYLPQINEHLLSHPPGIKVVVNVGSCKTETHVVAQQ